MMFFLIPLSSAVAAPPPTKTAPLNHAKVQERPLMDNERLDKLIQRLPGAKRHRDNVWEITFEGATAAVVTDARADRMRIVSQIGPAEQLTGPLALRMLQANYDAVLDARYAVAQGQIFSVFIHPLSTLDESEFRSGLAQTLQAASTFGTSFSSGALVFGGGDSNQLHEDLFRKVMEALEEPKLIEL